MTKQSFVVVFSKRHSNQFPITENNEKRTLTKVIIPYIFVNTVFIEYSVCSIFLSLHILASKMGRIKRVYEFSLLIAN